MKNTDIIYRNLFLPEWDSDLADFFYVALAELKRYSEEHDFADWEGPVPEITEWDNFLEIDFKLPGLHPESVYAEAIENVVILSGLRWCRIPNEDHERLLFFRRMVEVPKRADEESMRLYFRDKSEVILCVRERRSVTDECLSVAGNSGANGVRRAPNRGNGTERS